MDANAAPTPKAVAMQVSSNGGCGRDGGGGGVAVVVKQQQQQHVQTRASGHRNASKVMF